MAEREYTQKQREAIEYTKKAFAPPTPKQLEQQAQARARGGLTPSGIRKFKALSESEQQAEISKQRQKVGLPAEGIKKSEIIVRQPTRDAEGKTRLDRQIEQNRVASTQRQTSIPVISEKEAIIKYQQQQDRKQNEQSYTPPEQIDVKLKQPTETTITTTEEKTTTEPSIITDRRDTYVGDQITSPEDVRVYLETKELDPIRKGIIGGAIITSQKLKELSEKAKDPYSKFILGGLNVIPAATIALFQPVKTTEDAVNFITSPNQAQQGISQEFNKNPLFFSGEVATSFAVPYLLKKPFRRLESFNVGVQAPEIIIPEIVTDTRTLRRIPQPSQRFLAQLEQNILDLGAKRARVSGTRIPQTLEEVPIIEKLPTLRRINVQTQQDFFKQLEQNILNLERERAIKAGTRIQQTLEEVPIIGKLPKSRRINVQTQQDFFKQLEQNILNLERERAIKAGTRIPQTLEEIAIIGKRKFIRRIRSLPQRKEIIVLPKQNFIVSKRTTPSTGRRVTSDGRGETQVQILEQLETQTLQSLPSTVETRLLTRPRTRKTVQQTPKIKTAIAPDIASVTSPIIAESDLQSQLRIQSIIESRILKSSLKPSQKVGLIKQLRRRQKQLQEQQKATAQGLNTFLGTAPALLQTQHQTVSPTTAIRTEPKTTQKSTTVTRTKLKSKGSFLAPVKLPKPKTSKKTTTVSIGRIRAAYHVYVKKKLKKEGKGKYKSRGYTKASKRPLSARSADGLGMSIVDKYANRSYKKVPVDGIGRIDQNLINKYNRLKNKFRASKRNKNVVVEKSKHAIDSREELLGITYKARRAKRKKKSRFL